MPTNELPLVTTVPWQRSPDQRITITLTKTLGEGYTSKVYRGEVADTGLTDVPDMVAVKLGRPDRDPKVLEAFRSEYDTLEKLRQKASELIGEDAAKYFPKPLHPPTDFTAPGGKFCYFLMEFVQGQELQTVAAQINDVHEREQLCLKVGFQYAEVLQIMHAAGYTCNDRKLGDLIWRDEHLVVLDWNVVSQGEAGKPSDLEKFGIFWYELLVGRSATYHPTTMWRGRRIPMYWREPAWEELSWGVRRIVENLMSPAPVKPYHNAAEIKEDFDLHWKADRKTLIGCANSSADPMDKLACIDLALRRFGSDEELENRRRNLELEVTKIGEAKLAEAWTAVGRMSSASSEDVP